MVFYEKKCLVFNLRSIFVGFEVVFVYKHMFEVYFTFRLDFMFSYGLGGVGIFERHSDAYFVL